MAHAEYVQVAGERQVTSAGGMQPDRAPPEENKAFGWVKRLPTNILNPYVTPGGQLNIAKLGYIKSFDCRNVHNPAYLPALGLGSPPCVQQGPWTFNGKTAFYPRLTLAQP